MTFMLHFPDEGVSGSTLIEAVTSSLKQLSGDSAGVVSPSSSGHSLASASWELTLQGQMLDLWVPTDLPVVYVDGDVSHVAEFAAVLRGMISPDAKMVLMDDDYQTEIELIMGERAGEIHRMLTGEDMA